VRFLACAIVGTVVFCGCSSSGTGVSAIVEKYARPPAEGPWSLVSDTAEFWADVDVLYEASLEGDRDALRTLLVVDTFTDGAVAEGMPELYVVVQRHRAVAKGIILADSRLKAKFGHWIGEGG